MSTQLKLMLEQVLQLSRSEQLVLISTIAQALSQREEKNLAEKTPLVQSISEKPIITKGDKGIDPESLFGIWSDNPRNLTDIRQKAWRQH